MMTPDLDPNPTHNTDFRTWWSGRDLAVTKTLHTAKTRAAFLTTEDTIVVGDGQTRPITIPARRVNELIELLMLARDWTGPENTDRVGGE